MLNTFVSFEVREVVTLHVKTIAMNNIFFCKLGVMTSSIMWLYLNFIRFIRIIFYKNYFYLLIVFFMYLISKRPHKLVSFDIFIVYK